MRSEGYPLHSLKITNSISEIKNQLANIKEQLNFLEYEGLGELCHDLSDRIENVRVKLAKKNQLEVILIRTVTLYHEVEELERRFIKIKRESVEIFKIYTPHPSFIKLIDDMQNEVSILSMYKRDLDTYIHSSTPQPFTILLNKLNILDGQRKLLIPWWMTILKTSQI